MKIMDWIILGLFAFVATASASLGAEPVKTVQENFTQLEASIETAKDEVSGTAGAKFHWVELETFQSLLWRAMALDPSNVATVPVSQVPKNLFAVELNADLEQKLTELKKSTHPKEFQAEAEFNLYIATVEGIMMQRKARQFPLARATAKRGTLDSVYEALIKKTSTEDTDEISVPALAQIEDQVKVLKDQMETQPAKESAKKELFANGNRFIWFMLVAMMGFLMGLAGYRMNPDFFQKILDQFHSNTPTATTHSLGVTKLDYARWLRELEEILSRLKSSQLTLERRIEDIVRNSEKISQHSLSLYADPRIKNEANLEFRMSTLLREVQHQFDQSQRLRAGDRVQVNLMLEHCLKLCDAIENNSLHYDRTIPPPTSFEQSA